MEQGVKPTVGFIGIGVMGKSMAGHLLAAGYPLVVYNRTKAKAEALLAQGAAWAECPGAVAKACDVVITMVGYPKDVEETYLGENGLIAKGRQGALFIDMTTSSPALARRIAVAAKNAGMAALDAPVSGGDVGAREARLAIMVGGEQADFERAKPIFDLLGTNVVHQGEAGAGQHTKMCNQIVIAGNMVGVCEALAYAKTAGLEPEKVLGVIGSGAAGSWSLSNLGPRMLSGDFAPGFYVKHFIKDMTIALEEAAAMGLDTPGLALTKSLYERLAALGEADSGTQALYKLYVREDVPC